MDILQTHYLNTILNKSQKYLKEILDSKQYLKFLEKISYIFDLSNNDKNTIVKAFEMQYYAFVKNIFQEKYRYDDDMEKFLSNNAKVKKIIWDDCLSILRKMKSESVGCMVTSPPYYNAREYAQWENMDDYFDDMEEILKECYRVLDNHRVFVFNVGDIFDIEKDFIYAWRRDIKKINPVIKINSKGQNMLGHSAPFPQEIPEFAIKMFSYKGERVLDPFCGIGTSVKVAAKLGRVGIGIERDVKLKNAVYNFLGKENVDEYK